MKNKKKFSSSGHYKFLSPTENRVEDIVKGGLVSIPVGSSVRSAAEKMAEKGVGSLVVMRDDVPIGMVTKTDMVRRVLAKGISTDIFIDEVMSPEIISIPGEETLFDGLLLMIQHGIGHLVVTQEGRPVGMISERDWLAFQEKHPASSLWEIDRAKSIIEIADLRKRANSLIHHIFAEEGTAESLTELVTEINDRISVKIIELSLKEMESEPPVPFSWISMGSEGRMEQAISTDQDNGIIFSDVPEDQVEGVRNWFLRFAEKVVTGLELCGFPRCKGNIMASNPKLCLPLRDWKELFSALITNPIPDNLFMASIYFDFRSLYGEQNLVDELWEELLKQISKNGEFIKSLANAEKMFGKVPVNNIDWKMRAFFGLSPPPIDIKEKGLSPLVRSLRVIALKHGTSETNSMKRLKIIRKNSLLPTALADDIQVAYNFLTMLRIRRHFHQEAKGEKLHNKINFKRMNHLEGRFLVDALKSVIQLEEYTYDRFGSAII